MSQIYLGYPPPKVREWIENNYYKPAFKLTDPLCFTAVEAGSTITMSKNSSAPLVYLETSPTGKEGTWSDFTVDSTTITLANVGDKVYFRAKQDNERFGTSYSNYTYFIMTGKIAASGNLNTLLKADGSVLDLTGRDHCYSNMFYNCPCLTQAPELPATTLANYCYEYMFENCTSLTQASFPNLDSNTVINEVVENQYAFDNAADNIETQCSDRIIYINKVDSELDSYSSYYNSYMSYDA